MKTLQNKRTENCLFLLCFIFSAFCLFKISNARTTALQKCFDIQDLIDHQRLPLVIFNLTILLDYALRYLRSCVNLSL